jgi:Tfp pilus assembly protein PilF
MDDGPRGRRRRASGTVPNAEEFLFHLSRGSELLVENRIEHAKEELERALRVQPDDAKGQDLLASVYFRLGLYPRAIELWTRLARTHPSDVALRVNLGLVLLKTGQPEDARACFARAVEIDPQHARGFRYLGLAEWRCGQLDRARDAFLRGGEITMARRMEEMLGEAAEAPKVASTDRAELRSAAGDALERIATEAAPLSVPEPSDASSGGAWRVIEQGRESLPRTLESAHAEARGELAPLSRRLDAWTIAPSGPSLSVAASGLLVVDSTVPVVLRTQRVRASRAPIVGAPVMRRGRDPNAPAEPLGGSAPLVRVDAAHALIAPPEAHRFVAIALRDDGLYVVERHLDAFDDSLAHESARIGDGLDVVSLRGSGIVVLAIRTEPVALGVRAGDAATVREDALVGWTGRLFPEVDGSSVRAGVLSFRGEGTLLVI